MEKKSMATWFYFEFELYRYAHLYTHESNDRWMSMEMSEWNDEVEAVGNIEEDHHHHRHQQQQHKNNRRKNFSPPFNINFVLKKPFKRYFAFFHRSMTVDVYHSRYMYCRSHLWSHLHRIFPHFSLFPSSQYSFTQQHHTPSHPLTERLSLMFDEIKLRR